MTGLRHCCSRLVQGNLCRSKYHVCEVGEKARWRKGWDLNPRTGSPPAVFKTAAFGRSATLPRHYLFNLT